MSIAKRVLEHSELHGSLVMPNGVNGVFSTLNIEGKEPVSFITFADGSELALGRKVVTNMYFSDANETPPEKLKQMVKEFFLPIK